MMGSYTLTFYSLEKIQNAFCSNEDPEDVINMTVCLWFSVNDFGSDQGSYNTVWLETVA